MRRIVVWGATGSGKTTFARSLSAILEVPAVDLDEIRHANGWDSTPFDEFRVILTGRLEGSPEGWITAGGYREISDVYLSRCDTVVWLHLPLRVSFGRLLRRTLIRLRSREPYYPGSPARETWRKSFMSRESLLWWSLSHNRAGVATFRRALASLPPHIRTHELRSQHEVEEFLRVARLRHREEKAAG